MSHNQTPAEQWFPANDHSDLSSGGIDWCVELPPYAPSGRVLVNAPRLGRLARLGGYETLRISSYAGDATEVRLGGVSVGRDGTATYAHAAVKSEAVTERTLLEEPEVRLATYDEYAPRHGEIRLDMRAINRRVQARDGTLRDPEVWSAELNRELAAGFRGAANESLLRTPPLPTLLQYAFGTAMSVAAVTATHWGSSAAEMAGIVIGNIVGFHLISRPFFLARSDGHRPSERRWSIFPIYQLDRAFAVHALTRTLKLVKSAEDQAALPQSEY